MWKSLRIRLTLVFIGLAIGPVLVVGAVLIQRSFAVEQEQAVNLQGEVAQRVSAEVNSFFGEVENDLYLLGGEIRGLEQPDHAQELSILLGALNTGAYRDVYEELSLLDATGHEQLRVSRQEIVSTDELTDRSESEAFKQPKATRQTYFSPVEFDETTGQPFITIAIPLSELRSVEVSNVLVAKFRVAAIQNLIADLQISPEQTISILDSSNKVIVYKDPSVVLNGTTFTLPAPQGRTENISGTDVLFATDNVQLGDQQFTVVAERSASIALELAQNSLTVSAIVTGLALLAAIGLVTLTVSQVVRPIERLSAVAHRIQEGDLSARAEIKNQDEIGVLAQSFNNMTSRLQDTILSLEERVAERVRDLTLASETSRQITTELENATLLARVTDLTTQAFNLYHVSIFLYDDSDQSIQLRQGTGETGQRMVSEGKRFFISDQGLVPLAARSRAAAASNDALKDVRHFQNPYLPETRAELAVPMLYRGQLIGVLDFQSKVVNRFRDEDIRIMTTLAEQVAIAVRNAQLFEEVRVALEEAERANSVKSAFLASMSHELRTPLNSIINYSKFVAKGTLGPVNEEQEKMLLDVVDSAKHLLSLINDVLDMSKIESGSLKLFVEDDIDLKAILNKIVSTGKSLIADKPVTIETAIEDPLPLIRGDRQRILQILLNIISNACKFTETGTITVSAHQQGSDIEITVQDTGSGIAPEDTPAVFIPFKQTETGLRQGGGSGLGMPISKSLTESHGGKLWLESIHGKGSTFFVLLPMKSELLTPVNVAAEAPK